MRDKSKICKLNATTGIERGQFCQHHRQIHVWQPELPNPGRLPPHFVGGLALPQPEVDRDAIVCRPSSLNK
jgi:hypothetical protein